MAGCMVLMLALLSVVTSINGQACTRGTSSNIALGRPAFQSSNINSRSGLAGLAVDGNTATRYNQNSCTHTKGDTNPWWYVDLGSTKQIGTIILTNRGDCCGSRLNNIEIHIGDVRSKVGGTENPMVKGSPFRTAVAQGGSRAYQANGMAGRYVYVRLLGKQYLTLCEVQISEYCPKPCFNLALGQTTSQSSTAYAGPSSHAVDGNAESIYSAFSCTHTNNEPTPWWTVDLGMSRKISLVRITNRGDCCTTRLNGFEIRVGSMSATSGYSVCNTGDNEKIIYGGSTADFSCSGLGDKAISRYVHIVLPSTSNKVLTLCEVQVFEDCSPTCNNVALKKPTTQINTGWGGSSSRAVDGNTNGNYGGNSCTHTLNKNAAGSNYWYVDLGREYQISSVSISNRKDCCYTAYKNVQITVGNKISDFGQSNPTCKWPKDVRSTGTTKYPCSNLQGRYVAVNQWQKNTPLVLCEVQACGFPLPNSAAGKPIWMSSTQKGSSAYFAVDGSTSTTTSQCAITTAGTQSSISLDLGELSLVTSIYFTLPANTGMKNAIKQKGIVYLSSDILFTTHVTCANFSTYNVKSNTFSMICNSGAGVEGRYLRVILAAATKTALGICEMEVNTAKRVQCLKSGFQGRRCNNQCPAGTGGTACTKCPSAVFGAISLKTTSVCFQPKGGSLFPTENTLLEYTKACSTTAAQFAFTGNGALQHVPSGLCVIPTNEGNAAPIAGSNVKLSTKCTSDFSAFNYDPVSNQLIHDKFFTTCLGPFVTGTPAVGSVVTMVDCKPQLGVKSAWQFATQNFNQWTPVINTITNDARFGYYSSMWTSATPSWFGSATDLSKDAFLSTYDSINVNAFSVTMGKKTYNFTLPGDISGKYSFKELVLQGKLSFATPAFQGRSNLFSLTYSGVARASYYCGDYGFSQTLFTGVTNNLQCQGKARIGVTTSVKTQYGPVQLWNQKCMSVGGTKPKDNVRVVTSATCSGTAANFYMTTDNYFQHSSGKCIRVTPSVKVGAILVTGSCTGATKFQYQAGSRQMIVAGTKLCVISISNNPGNNIYFVLTACSTKTRTWNFMRWLSPPDSAATPCQRNKPVSAEGIGLTSGCWPLNSLASGNLQGPTTPSKFFAQATIYVLGVPRCMGTSSCNRILGTCDCPAGSFGPSCENTCPTGRFGLGCRQLCACKNGATCDAKAGTCTCPAGYFGADCSVPCPANTFGSGCKACTQCSAVSSDGCNPTTGKCICKAGYGGTNCNSICNSAGSPAALTNKWGKNCANPCKCSKNSVCSGVDGTCTCDPGYQGTLCGRTCSKGFYGQGCGQKCTCRNGANCDHITGSCTCTSGYTGSDCASTCNTIAPAFQCGLNCLQTCKCDPVNGVCDPKSCGCSSCKPGYRGQFCKTMCPTGKYGQGCAMTCNCANGGVCNPVDGTCTCAGGWWGPNCKKRCQANLYGPGCTQACNCGHGKCDPVSGQCSCDPGYAGTSCSVLCKDGKFGLNCNTSCNCDQRYIDQTASRQCDAVTGFCNCQSPYVGRCDTVCKDPFQWGNPCGSKGTCDCVKSNAVGCNQQTGACDCKPGWTGAKCQTACSSGRWGLNCIFNCQCHSHGSTCDPVTGDCNCLAGWTGHTCGFACPNGTYGVNCTNTCNCVMGSCDRVSGVCTCQPGFQGAACDQSCATGKYGLGCGSSCTCSNGTCDPTTGACSCSPGFVGASCDQVCQPGKYGVGCSLNCPNCQNAAHATGSCTPLDGSCVCSAGYRGPLCQDTCPGGWYGLNCAMKCNCNGSPCNETTGVCNCAAGTMGANCSQTCPPNKYGVGCTSVCSCFNGATCDVKTGACSCAPGYWGLACIESCPKGYAGPHCLSACNCTKTGTCNAVNGACVCDAGFTGSTCSNVISCNTGFYGPNCNLACRCQNGGTCAAHDGSCTCPPGFRGLLCEEGCPAGTWGAACGSTCRCVNGDCLPNNGSCACYAGYMGAICTAVCPDGRWGPGCTTACNCSSNSIICSKENGACDDPNIGAVGDTGSTGTNTAAIVVPIIVVLVIIGVIVVVVIVRSVRKVEKKMPAGMYTADDSDITYSSTTSSPEHGISNPTYADPGHVIQAE